MKKSYNYEFAHLTKHVVLFNFLIKGKDETDLQLAFKKLNVELQVIIKKIRDSEKLHEN